VSSSLLLLLVVSICLLGTMGIGVDAIRRGKKQSRRFRERMMLVAKPYERVNPLTVMGYSAPSSLTPITQLLAPAARLFGYESVHARHYPVRWWVVLSVALAAARGLAAMLAIFFGSWSLLVVPPAWLILTRFVFNWSKRRRSDALYTQLPDALAMIVRAVRVGIPLTEGIRSVAREAASPTGPEFAALHDRISIGVMLEDALHEMAGRNQVTEYRYFATVIGLQSQTGGGLAEALDGLADVMRRRLALKARGHALAAEAKTSIFILASMPFVTGGALAVLNPVYIGRLFSEPGCQKILMTAIILLSSGLLVMRAMIRSALS
jgi:tight adherence protein B